MKHKRELCYFITLPKRRERYVFLHKVWKNIKNLHDINFIFDHDIRIHENVKELYDDAVRLIREIDVMLFFVQLDFLDTDEERPDYDSIFRFTHIPYSVSLFVLPPDLKCEDEKWVNGLYERFREENSEIIILPHDEEAVASIIAYEFKGA
ncbi:MAG: hypothetical protein IJB43_11315 [Clostridia bacterium]|nr:hypothetical protein [Clostridia bacterium]